MSVVIGLKWKDTVFMACDGLSTSNVKHYSGRKYGQKIIILDSEPIVLIGNTGRAKSSQLNRMLNNVFEKRDPESKLSYDFMVNNVYPKIIELQNEYRLKTEDEFPNVIKGSRLIASGSQLYMVSENNDGAIMEIDSFSAIGTGAELAIGSLYATEKHELSPQQRLIEALCAATQYDESVAPPYYLFNTAKKSVEFYEPRYDYNVTTLSAEECE